MRKLMVLIALVVMVNGVMAKAKGKFLRYTQITDKEVLVESTKGVMILFKAYDNNSIGIAYFDKADQVSLTSPGDIWSHTELKGSIYVEELDDLMQITTVSDDGVMAKLDKKHFEFIFVDKGNNTNLFIGEGLVAGVVSRNQTNDMVRVDNEQIHKYKDLRND